MQCQQVYCGSGKEVGRRWEGGGREVERKWEGGGKEVGRRWEGSGKDFRSADVHEHSVVHWE
jgi:hypothetical protein